MKNGHVRLHGLVKTLEEKGRHVGAGGERDQNTVLVQDNAPETEKKPDLTEKTANQCLKGRPHQRTASSCLMQPFKREGCDETRY
jgi:hypothetical protein